MTCTKLKEIPGTIVQPARSFDPTNLVENVDFSNRNPLGQTPAFRLKPREFRLAFTRENITVPHNLAASVQGKSSLARAGLGVHITAPHIHPGFSGPITLELYNHGPWELELVPGEDLVCQVIYYSVKSAVSKRVAVALGTYLDQEAPFPVRRAGRPDARPTSRSKRQGKTKSR